MDKAVTHCKNKDIKTSMYFRFCCLVDFFQVDMEDLFDEYILRYTDAEGICTDDIKKYFVFDMQRYKNNEKSLTKFCRALTYIIEDTDTYNENSIMEKARKDVIDSDLMELVRDWNLFITFFESLFIFTQTVMQEKIVQVRAFDEMPLESMRLFLQTRYIMSDIGVNIDNTIITKLWEKKFILSKEVLNFFVRNFAFPVYELLNAKSEKEVKEITDKWIPIYINWDILLKITTDRKLRKKFSKILKMRFAQINEEIEKTLAGTVDSSYEKSTRDLLVNAKRFSFILQYEYTSKRVSSNKIAKWLFELSESESYYRCYEFCKKHFKKLQKVKEEQIELLFYYACTYIKN